MPLFPYSVLRVSLFELTPLPSSPFVINRNTFIGLPKGPIWDGRNVAVPDAADRSLIGLRDWHSHAERRKLWNKGFNTAALKDYEGIVIRRGKQLLDALESRQETVDIATWLGYFT
jgi:hypothetical protein